MNTQIKLVIAVLLIFCLSYFLGSYLARYSSPVSVHSQNSDCRPHKGACELTQAGQVFTLQFIGEPSALNPFEVQVAYKGKQPERLGIEFEMRGMDMGFNRYVLKKGPQYWSTSVILPVCTLGRNDWTLTLRAEFGQQIYVSRLQFAQGAAN